MTPMLAATVKDLEQLEFPLLASPKLDGIRCLLLHGKVYSRNMKLLPNMAVQDVAATMALHGLDGEIVVGDPRAKDCFNVTTSGIMSRTGDPGGGKWAFHIFDYIPDDAYAETWFARRLRDVKSQCANFPKVLKPVAHKMVESLDELLRYESQMLTAGFEGVMLRDTHGPYKFGRSTLREGYLMKLKRFVDSEARIYGFKEQEENTNVQTRDELGRAKRSSAKSGKRPKGVLGALEVRDVKTGISFDVGTGFSDTLRSEIWDARDTWIGKIIKYRYQPVGVKDKPRFPTYIGLRDPIDL